MRKGFLIYEEMRRYFPRYEEAVSHICLCNCSVLNFLIYEGTLIFFFISVVSQHEPASLYNEQYMETTKMTFPIHFSSIIFGLIISSDSEMDYGEIYGILSSYKQRQKGFPS
jgi:hypothetical protein